MILIDVDVTLTPWCLGALVPWYNWAEAEGGFWELGGRSGCGEQHYLRKEVMVRA